VSTDTGYIMDQTLRKKLTEGSQQPFGTALSHIAKTFMDGSKLDDSEVETPYQIFYKSPYAGIM